MATVLLVRHGRTAANTGAVLAGRTPGTRLDDEGRRQVESIGRRIAALPLQRIVSSPLERCRETAAAIAAQQPTTPRVRSDKRLNECDYGAWTGELLKALSKQPLWKVVQAHPSGVRFPEGESMPAMQARAVAAVREIDAEVEAEAGPDGLWVAVSHGDVIKSVLAEALGMHFDLFQRVVVDPASVSVIRFTPLRPFVVHLNDSGSALGPLRPPKRRRRRVSSDAPVGGGAGDGGTRSTGRRSQTTS